MRQIFINLPVKDVEASMNFYMQLGFNVNPLFTFEDQKCMVWTEQIYVMLQTLEKSKRGDEVVPTPYSAATFTLPVESLEKVNEMMERGLKAGGTEPRELVDEGFMIKRHLDDLDGHSWVLIFLDMEKFKAMRPEH